MAGWVNGSKNPKTVFRVITSEHRGVDYLEVREYYENERGMIDPTDNGFAIPLGSARELIQEMVNTFAKLDE